MAKTKTADIFLLGREFATGSEIRHLFMPGPMATWRSTDRKTLPSRGADRDIHRNADSQLGSLEILRESGDLKPAHTGRMAGILADVDLLASKGYVEAGSLYFMAARILHQIGDDTAPAIAEKAIRHADVWTCTDVDSSGLPWAFSVIGAFGILLDAEVDPVAILGGA